MKAPGKLVLDLLLDNDWQVETRERENIGTKRIGDIGKDSGGLYAVAANPDW